MADLKAVCVMLADGRPAMVRRAIRCFMAQTYLSRRLYVFDSGRIPIVDVLPDMYPAYAIAYHRTQMRDSTIGALRNVANEWAALRDHTDIILHWDSDDWSHRRRISEQVAFLRKSGKSAVGYNEMIFWDERPGQFPGAWKYKSLAPDYCLGTSLCYRTEAWRHLPFHDGPNKNAEGGLTDCAEDLQWQMRVDRASVPAFKWPPGSPLMIASVHGNNTLSRIQPQLTEWTRAADYDAYCAERMAL